MDLDISVRHSLLFIFCYLIGYLSSNYDAYFPHVEFINPTFQIDIENRIFSCFIMFIICCNKEYFKRGHWCINSTGNPDEGLNKNLCYVQNFSFYQHLLNACKFACTRIHIRDVLKRVYTFINFLVAMAFNNEIQLDIQNR